ncbi:MAG TPA: DinB family protein [Ohtaekwangia sp.]|uniref:DinB family protein n=1 Tax=Ohtaekwangia sp. TaxID=2066019 RepID=UPI002F942F1D
MVSQVLRTILNRDLNKLRQEIASYRQESNLWRVDKDIANSAGNLCLHLVGNLNTYIGATLGNSGYVRNRDLEFSAKGVAQEELLRKIDDTIQIVDKVLSTLTEEQLKQEYPMQVLAEKTSTEFFLVHLATHLTYHLGQVNYHRRLLDSVASTVHA